MALSDELLNILADNYKRNISGAIFAIALYENSIQKNEYFIELNYSHIYQIILEEYNKVASHNYQESIKYEPITFTVIKWIFKDYGINL